MLEVMVVVAVIMEVVIGSGPDGCAARRVSVLRVRDGAGGRRQDMAARIRIDAILEQRADHVQCAIVDGRV